MTEADFIKLLLGGITALAGANVLQYYNGRKDLAAFIASTEKAQSVLNAILDMVKK